MDRHKSSIRIYESGLSGDKTISGHVDAIQLKKGDLLLPVYHVHVFLLFTKREHSLIREHAF